MLSGCNKYLTRFLLKPIVTIGFIFSFSIAASAQIYYNDVFGKYPLINPLLSEAFKKPIKPTPLLSAYIKPAKHELMYLRNFPLTPAQAAAKDREWERKNNRPIGEQIAGDIIKSQVNSLIYGKKKPVAVNPKF